MFVVPNLTIIFHAYMSCISEQILFLIGETIVPMLCAFEPQVYVYHQLFTNPSGSISAHIYTVFLLREMGGGERFKFVIAMLSMIALQNSLG